MWSESTLEWPSLSVITRLSNQDACVSVLWCWRGADLLSPAARHLETGSAGLCIHTRGCGTWVVVTGLLSFTAESLRGSVLPADRLGLLEGIIWNTGQSWGQKHFLLSSSGLVSFWENSAFLLSVIWSPDVSNIKASVRLLGIRKDPQNIQSKIRIL